MARFMVSMPDEMIRELDQKARAEHRSRSELLREAVRRELAASGPRDELRNTAPKRTQAPKKWTKRSLQRHLLERGLAERGAAGLEAVLGRANGPVDMKQVLRITKKLAGVSKDIIDDREDRL
jgi:Arc/MetJ-type ribon-helix-helix transcriptional regulator